MSSNTEFSCVVCGVTPAEYDRGLIDPAPLFTPPPSTPPSTPPPSYGTMDDVGPEGLSYYKGTACPILPEGDCGLKATAYDILVGMLRDGLSIGDIGDNIIAQMDAIEETLRLADGGQTTHKAIQCVIDKFPGAIKDQCALMTIWYTNVHILLKIKRLENDNMNGMMYRSVMDKNVIFKV